MHPLFFVQSEALLRFWARGKVISFFPYLLSIWYRREKGGRERPLYSRKWIEY